MTPELPQQKAEQLVRLLRSTFGGRRVLVEEGSLVRLEPFEVRFLADGEVVVTVFEEDEAPQQYHISSPTEENLLQLLDTVAPKA